MANGGSFMVGGGYSANDNKIAAFPVASGEQVVVNRNRKGGQGGQVIHIDNRTIINGRVDADVFAQMKVSQVPADAADARGLSGGLDVAIDNVRLPVEVEQGATGGPRFKTSIQTALSGIEQRIAEWDVARCEYDISYAVRGKAELISEVIKIWRDRLGPAYPFRFKDWSDFEADDVSIGTGDGRSTAFQLVKSYGLVFVVNRIIQLPVEGTVAITVAGVAKIETTRLHRRLFHRPV